MIAAVLAATARIVSGASVHWTQALEPGRQRIFFGNHTSHLDFVVIWSSLPPALRARTRPVAGADYWERGRVRHYLATRVFNAVLIARPSGGHSPSEAGKSIARLAAAMDGGCDMIVFPEGTRSLDGEVHPFKSGIYHLCRLKPDVELVPVYLANMNRILPKGEIVPVPLLGRVVFGAPLHLEPGEEKAAFLGRARDALLALRDQ